MNCDKVQACRAVVDAVQAATEVLRSSDSLSQVPCPALLRNSGAALARFVSHTDVLHKQSYIRFDEPALMVAAIAILLAPLIWNTVARIEYYTRIFSRILGKHVAAYLLALWIFCFSLYRDLLFYVAIVGQPQLNVLQQPAFAALGWTCSAVGLVLVLSSMARLGVAGTYLGDYFGILQTCKVSAFPYNILDDPMCVFLSRLHYFHYLTTSFEV